MKKEAEGKLNKGNLYFLFYKLSLGEKT